MRKFSADMRSSMARPPTRVQGRGEPQARLQGEVHFGDLSDNKLSAFERHLVDSRLHRRVDPLVSCERQSTDTSASGVRPSMSFLVSFCPFVSFKFPVGRVVEYF